MTEGNLHLKRVICDATIQQCQILIQSCHKIAIKSDPIFLCSARKPEVQSFITNVCCVIDVVQLLFLSHRIPLCLTPFISHGIINLRKGKESNVENQNAQENFVTSAVSRRVVCETVSLNLFLI